MVTHGPTETAERHGRSAGQLQAGYRSVIDNRSVTGWVLISRMARINHRLQINPVLRYVTGHSSVDSHRLGTISHTVQVSHRLQISHMLQISYVTDQSQFMDQSQVTDQSQATYQSEARDQ